MRVRDKQSRDTCEDRLETVLDYLKSHIDHNTDILNIFLIILRDLSQNDLADIIEAKYNGKLS